MALRDTVHFPGLVNTLHIVRDPSLRAVRKSMEKDRIVLVLSQRDMAIEDPGASDLCRVGTLSEALQAIPLPDTSLRVALRGLRRVRASKVISKSGLFWAEIEEVVEAQPFDLETEALMRVSVESFTRIVHLNKDIPPESLEGVVHADSPGSLADTILHHLPLRAAEKQQFLEELDQKERLQRVMSVLKREEQILSLNSEIRQRVERELGDSQREFFLREQLRIIQNELHEREDRVGEVDELREKILQAKMPAEAHEKAMAELKRLDRAPAASPEGMVSRNYVETLVALPWAITTEDRLDVRAAAELLDQRHFGLSNVKDRILDHLAVRQLKDSLRGPILCFIGPPGVGKTSIGRSIAEAMGRRFARISLGGVRDEAEIRGHRRTYVGSMPGRIIQALKDCSSRNPVILLDEIDKVGQGIQGDPTSALLEALDPEQNARFTDHYVEAPFDLSSVMFIATANLAENIPPPLRDRMEIIPFSSYTEEERKTIAREYLLPHNISEHGLRDDQIRVPDEMLQRLVTEFTREAGVRDLDRQIAKVCRKVARKVAGGEADQIELTGDLLREFIGRPRFSRSDLGRKDEVGVAWGLVVGEFGGAVVPIEVSLIDSSGSRASLQLTGNLGDVMKESAQAALTWVQSEHGVLKKDVHIHVPEGAIPKDGPSAGVTLAAALASSWLGKPSRANVAMTGEITLRGRVLPVGGIREKVLAAVRSGMTHVILPKDNIPDLEDVPSEALSQIEVHPVEHLIEVIGLALAV